MRNYYLYALYDPIFKIPKYIGISNNPKRRFKEHLEDLSNTRKTRWIKTLKNKNLLPILKIIKETDDVHKVIKWEQQSITKLKDKYDLVNTTSGGEYYAIGTPIKVFTMKGEYLESYNSMIEYCEIHNMNINCVSGISNVCIRKRNHAYNHIFRYLDDEVTEQDITKLNSCLHDRDPKHIYVYNFDGTLVGNYESIQQAVKSGIGSAAGISGTLNNRLYSTNNYIICEDQSEFNIKLANYYKGKSKHTVIEGKVNQYTLEGLYIASFNSYSEAARKVKGTSGNVKNCCIGKSKQYKGYIWKISNDINNLKLNSPIKYNPKKLREVEQYDLSGNLIKIWKNLKEIADFYNVSKSLISQACTGKIKTAIQYIWKYKEAV